MMGLTTNRHDGCLHEVDPETGMNKCYLILPDGERKNLVRPIRHRYIHEKCGSITTMSHELAETYAANPSFYSATFCVACKGHFPVGEHGEFIWDDGSGEKVGT